MKKYERYAHLSKSEKILIAIGELANSGKDKITVEDVAVKLWLLWPSEFCMRGYPQYPNVDIQKYITKLLENNLVSGGVFNYKITEKGRKIFDFLMKTRDQKENKNEKFSAEQPRHINSEIKRIINSNVFKYFIKNEDSSFFESDFFEFLGASARSFNTRNRNVFVNRYNIIVKDLIPYCEKTKDKNEYAKKILELWNVLSKQFSYILDKR